MKVAGRIERLPPYLFVEISKKIADKREKGINIINFGIGDPDMPTPQRIIKTLCSAAKKPANHRYPETAGLPLLCQAIAKWYKKRFSVNLDAATEVLPLIGSKEGIGHISFCYLNPGDIALITDPGYPVYGITTALAGGKPYYMTLKEKDGFLPDFSLIPNEIVRKAKLLWLNYPNNPTGATADLEFFEKAVRFALQNDLLICHDAPYSEVYYKEIKPPSILQIKNSKRVAVEFHSFSKTYNMTGWRVGMVVGNAQAVDALFRFKTNLDSGIPQAIQYMAVEALKGTEDEIISRNLVYQKRRDKLCKALKQVGFKFNIPAAGFYIWAKVPSGYSSEELTRELLEKTDIVVTPGTGYGPGGEGYVRFSITLENDRLEEGIKRLLRWHRGK